MKKSFPHISLRFPLLLSALLLWTATFAAITPEEAIKKFIRSEAVDSASTAIYIWDLMSDRRVVLHQADVPLTPASVMKCVTTAALKSTLPYNTQLYTRVYLSGQKNDTTFSGKITIAGSCDPSLGDRRHKDQPDLDNEIASYLASQGIRAFVGDIIIDDSLIAGPATHPTWGKGDLTQAYGTGVHAFNFMGNASGKAAVTSPSTVFVNKLKKTMADKGISFTQADASGSKFNAGRKLIVSHPSPSMARLMQSCMFRSDNLYAEAFMRMFGKKKGTDGSPHASAKKAMQHWDSKGYDLTGVEIVDGSGLSRSNYLTARFLGEMLREMSNDPTYVSFFPLVGEEGTVTSFMKGSPLAGYLALKTGSMTGVQSYAGYLLDEEFEPTHVVVAITNNLKNRAAYRQSLAELFLNLFK